MPDGITFSETKFHSTSESLIVQQTQKKVLNLLERILSDRPSGTYFFKSDTGTGKTTGVIAALKHFSDAKISIAVPTTSDAQAVYERAVEALDPETVGVWSRDHEAGKYGAPLDRGEEAAKRVFIGTHMFLLGDTDPRRHVGERDLLIVDEIPQNMAIRSLSPKDFTAARSHANELALSCAESFRNAATWVEKRQSDAESVQQADFRTLTPPSEARVQDALDEVERLRIYDSDKLQPILDFFTALKDGRGFERVERTGQGHRLHFVSFGEPNTWFPKQLILSATPHLDGFQHSPYAKNLSADEGSSVCYDNLTIHEVPWPDLPKAAHEIKRDRIMLSLAVDHMRELVARTKTDQVLLVAPMALTDNIKKSLEQDPVQSKEVQITNWGRDVGSNEYRDCGDVILWSNFHKPKHSAVAQWFLYSGQKMTRDLLREHAGNGRLKSDTVEELQKGQLYAQIKQMGCRGKARFVDENGVCESMHLWICWDELDPLRLKEIFPRHQFSQEGGFEERFINRPSGTIKRLVRTLNQIIGDEVTLSALAPRMGVSLKTLQNRGGDFIQASDLLSLYGWRYVPGKRGRSGKPARFVRTSNN